MFKLDASEPLIFPRSFFINLMASTLWFREVVVKIFGFAFI